MTTTTKNTTRAARLAAIDKRLATAQHAAACERAIVDALDDDILERAELTYSLGASPLADAGVTFKGVTLAELPALMSALPPVPMVRVRTHTTAFRAVHRIQNDERQQSECPEDACTPIAPFVVVVDPPREYRHAVEVTVKWYAIVVQPNGMPLTLSINAALDADTAARVNVPVTQHQSRPGRTPKATGWGTPIIPFRSTTPSLRGEWTRYSHGAGTMYDAPQFYLCWPHDDFLRIETVLGADPA